MENCGKEKNLRPPSNFSVPRIHSHNKLFAQVLNLDLSSLACVFAEKLSFLSHYRDKFR